MRITRYSRSSGRGDYHHRLPAKSYRRRGGHDDQLPRELTGHNLPNVHSTYHGHERRNRAHSPDERLLDCRERFTKRQSRERYRTTLDDYSRHSASRERSLSSVLSDISSGSSCFGTVRASEAYGSPVYEDLTDDDICSLEQALTESSMNLSVAPPPMVKHKKRKKDKRKKEKSRERERKRAKKDKRRQKEILEERICPPEHEVAQSKEIFASGQNILVSLSFIDNEKGKERSDRHKKSKRKKAKREKNREKLIVTKEELVSEATPSARSPQRDSPSPSRAHDTEEVKEKYNLKLQSAQSEQEKKLELQQQQQPQLQQQLDQPQSTTHQSPQQNQPPSKKKKLDPGVKPVMVIDLERSPSGQVISSPKEVIVLSDEESKQRAAQRSGREDGKTNDIDLSNRGPNTPPEPAPKSPDSYDPFEPTKSTSSTGISRHDLGSISSLSFLDHHHPHPDDQKEAKSDFHHHPLASHNSMQHHHPHHLHGHHSHHHHGHGVQERLQTEPMSGCGGLFGTDEGVLDLHPESPLEKMDVANSSPSRTGGTGLPYHHHHHHHLPHLHSHSSPMKAIIKSMPKKLLASGGGGRDSRSHGGVGKPNASGTTVGQQGASGGGATTSGGVPFEDDLNDGDISPYSPRSSDCDEQLFEPPNHDGNGETQTIALTVDNLRKVFGNDPKTLYGDLRKSFQHRSVIAVDEMYKPHKMTLEMLDEIPDSAVDMQVKEKLIKKLQRQERIVEEVKHFLKPHFNKKRIDKDEYKEIMRKSIPKICHSRSGEINPAKIQALITAYVKKAIAKRKLMGGEGSASGTPMVSTSGYGLPPASTNTAPAATLPPVMLLNR
ncbi:mediator of RNA polymerase II transcription subunit 13-like [Anopheles nili]|uniref:mediator of RNA polymerase II transcription subunit 13-like n=1 Tax=Anopheles nili TaxID=185578 RepID=UPI00237B404E|nr:mediator of RNA polymerase II transcription subunit 13-like [Anopheles nili]